MGTIFAAAKYSDRTLRGWYLLAALVYVGALLLVLIPLNGIRVLLALPFAVTAAWSLFRWLRLRAMAKARHAVRTRLARLPGDFRVLHNLLIPAPWGTIQVDHVILSRFGVVVVGTGRNCGWMMERVEAVRSWLVARGAAPGSLPISPLVLLPPGAPVQRLPESDAPTIRVEYIELTHLAPGMSRNLTPDQLRSITLCLEEAQQGR